MNNFPPRASPAQEFATERSTILHPPNSQQFSDQVIGNTIQRARSAQVSMDTRSQTLVHPNQRLETSQGHELRLSATVGRWGQHKRQSIAPTVKSELPGHNDAKSQDQHAAMIDLVVSEQKRVRELRRMRQIRYRKKKDNYANSLDEETQRIKEEVKKLEERRRSVSSASPASQSFWSVVVEYFRLLQYGIREEEKESVSCQASFLQSSMTADVVFNGGHNVQMMIENWKLVSLWFPNIELELETLDKTAEGWLVASTTTTITFSEETLRTVFPHLHTSDADETQVGALIDKLMGRTIAMSGLVRFKWDNENYQISSIISETDLLSPMLQLLGTLEDVSRAFENALITPDFQAQLSSCNVNCE